MRTRLALHLWTRTGPPPPELIRCRLRMLYHCTPSQLERESGQHLLEMLRDLVCLEMEAEAAEQRTKLGK